MKHFTVWIQSKIDKICHSPISSEISDLCKISDLLLFLVNYFASQNKRIKFGDYFFHVCCANSNVLVRCQIPTTSNSTDITTTTKWYWACWCWTSINYVSFTSLNINPNPTKSTKQ